MLLLNDDRIYTMFVQDLEIDAVGMEVLINVVVKEIFVIRLNIFLISILFFFYFVYFLLFLFKRNKKKFC